MIRYKMGWTVCYFLHKASCWDSVSGAIDTSPGAAAYAHWQSAMWRDLAYYADQSFTNIDVTYISPV